jgi:hypothetical protein
MITTNLKRFALILSLSTAVSTAIAPRPAHAIVGAFTAGATLPAAGGVLIGIGLGAGLLFGFPAAIILSVDPTDTASNWGWGIGGIGVPALMVLTGIVLLDEQGDHARFQTMTPAVAQKIQATEAERQAFNDELEEINLVAESAWLDAQAKMTPIQIAERYAGTLSPTAKNAVAKILKGTVGKAKAAAK